MTYRFSALFCFPLFLIAIVAIPGCGGKSMVTVSGKIVLPGKMKLEKTDSVNVQFVPETKGDSAPPVTYNPEDGTFTTAKIVPGKYKVAVQLSGYMGDPKAEKRSELLEPLNKTFSTLTSKLTYEVTAEAQQRITIDLGKSSVAKD